MVKRKSVSAVATAPEKIGNVSDDEYHHYLDLIQQRFLANLGSEGVLFQTDASRDGALWEAYLLSFPARDRQYHTCHACRDFVERFGGLVTISDTGTTSPAIWHEEDATDHERDAVAALAAKVRRANVTGVFLSGLAVWGNPITGIWRHMAVTPPTRLVYPKGRVLTAGQAAAEKREDFLNVVTALKEFPLPLLAQALRVVKSDTLYRAEKVAGPVQWLHDLAATRAKVKGRASANLVWRAVGSAPAGFCHPRSSMAGTLLEDLASGASFEDVSARFKAKMHPLRYQRPTEAPAVANIEQAEKIVEKLGIAASLRRRYARLDEVTPLWLPRVECAAPGTGVFGHLKAKDTVRVEALNLPATTITFDKFRRTVFPDALKIELRVPHGNASFIVLTTASDPEAPPIMQWDSLESRNPIAWYFWNGGAPASQFGIQAGTWREVPALSLMPPHWQDEAAFSHVAPGAVFCLQGARETRQGGLALFPESMRSDLHAVRSTIEAFSRNGQLEGAEEGSACGIGMRKGSPWNVRLRVTMTGGTQEYQIDRWD